MSDIANRLLIEKEVKDFEQEIQNKVTFLEEKHKSYALTLYVHHDTHYTEKQITVLHSKSIVPV